MDARLVNDGKPLLKLNSIQQHTKRQIERKLESGDYKCEQVPCLLCNNSDFEPLAEKDRYGLATNVVICKQCGLVMTNPRMTQLSYNEFYNQEYRKLYVGTAGPTETFFGKQYRQGEKIYRYLAKRAPFDLKGKLVLEVGCGAGGILKYFQDQGCEVIGTDLGETYIEYGKQTHGLNLKIGPLADLQLQQKPDLIIYSHVLEHIVNLEEEIAHIRNQLADNGVCFIEVPGIKNLSSSYNRDLLRYLQNAHVFHFTLPTLKNMLGKHGLSLVHGNEYIRAIFKKSPPVSGEPQNDYPATLSYLRNLQRFRVAYRLFPCKWQRIITGYKNF